MTTQPYSPRELERRRRQALAALQALAGLALVSVSLAVLYGAAAGGLSAGIALFGTGLWRLR